MLASKRLVMVYLLLKGLLIGIAFSLGPATFINGVSKSLIPSQNMRITSGVHRKVDGNRVAGHYESPSGTLAAFVVGMTGTFGVIAAVTRQRARRARITARANLGAPSLLQLAEQKKLLSLVQNSRLLSAAEQAGVRIETVEKLGLLKLAEEKGLLSLAETVLTNPQTPLLLIAGSLALAFLAYLDLSQSELGFLQWYIAGALGTPALILFGAGVVIFSLTSGARRTADIDVVSQSFDIQPGTTKASEKIFTYSTEKQSISLINTLEKKKLLSAVEEAGLLTTAASVINKPLTFTENLRILPQLENAKLLSFLESKLVDPLFPAIIGGAGGAALVAAIVTFFGLPGTTGLVLALVLVVVSVALVVGGIVLASLSAKADVAPETRF